MEILTCLSVVCRLGLHAPGCCEAKPSRISLPKFSGVGTGKILNRSGDSGQPTHLLTHYVTACSLTYTTTYTYLVAQPLRHSVAQSAMCKCPWCEMVLYAPPVLFRARVRSMRLSEPKPECRSSLLLLTSKACSGCMGHTHNGCTSDFFWQHMRHTARTEGGALTTESTHSRKREEIL